MKIMRNKLGLVLSALALVLLTACGGGKTAGGGGGGGGGGGTNTAPVANAGAAQTVVTGALVTLDGSASSDANSDALTYVWTLTAVPAGSAVTDADLSSTTAVGSTFTTDVDGDYVLSLVVNDATVDSAPASVTITAATGNIAPVANAGGAQTVATGNLVTLDGSASSDANVADTLTYVWTFTAVPAGSGVTDASLSSATAVGPTFTTDVDGDYVLSLVVNDATVDSTPASVTIKAATGNIAPVANAGAAQNVATSTLVTLDGSASSDANSDTLTYLWTFTSVPTGSGVTDASLSSTTAVGPTFTPDLGGDYVLSLVVNDATVDSAAASVTITVNTGPVANAGAAQNVTTGTLVTLDGSASSDADVGDTITYLWMFTSVPAGSGVTDASLSSATAVGPTFTPDLGGDYVLSLVVNDATVDSAAASVTITANTVPVADAGAAQSVTTGTLVTLDGSASSDADVGDTITYVWMFTSVPAGSGVTDADLSSATAVGPTFTTDVDGDYVLSLVVNDATVNSPSASVTITAKTANIAPVANAGAAQSVATGTLVTLDGSASSDANSDGLTYLWTFTSVPGGSGVTDADLSSATAVGPTFTTDVDGDYVLSLVVNDATVNSPSASVTITAATSTADNVVVAITDNVGLFSTTTYVENGADVLVIAGLDQTFKSGPQTMLMLEDTTNNVIMAMGYLGTATGVQTFNAIDISGYYADPTFFGYIESGAAPTGGSIDVTTYGAVGGAFAGTYSMDLCSTADILGGTCDATTAVNFAGTFSAQVDETLGSVANPQTIPIDGMEKTHALVDTLVTNYYMVSGLTSGTVYSLYLDRLAVGADLNLALTTDATYGTPLTCDVLNNIGNGAGLAEECQFTANASGLAYFKVGYVAGAALETYGISLGLPGGLPELSVAITGTAYDVGLDELTINYTVTNNGLKAVDMGVDPVDVDWFFNPLAAPVVGDPGDDFFTHNFGVISAGGGTVTGTLVVPGNAADTTGTAYLIVDSIDFIFESDETNNVSTGAAW